MACDTSDGSVATGVAATGAGSRSGGLARARRRLVSSANSCSIRARHRARPTSASAGGGLGLHVGCRCLLQGSAARHCEARASRRLSSTPAAARRRPRRRAARSGGGLGGRVAPAAAGAGAGARATSVSAGGKRRSWPPARAVLPLVRLPPNLGVGDGRRQRVEIGGLGQAQRRAGAQHIDVAAERGGIRLVDRDHHLIDRDAVGTQPVGDRPQRLGALHGTIDAARTAAGRSAVRSGVVPARCSVTARERSAPVRGAGAGGAGWRGRTIDLHRRARCCPTSAFPPAERPAERPGAGSNTGGSSSTVYSRDVATARPGGLEQQRHERLGDRLARGDLDDVAAAAIGHDSKLETVEKRRAIEAAARRTCRAPARVTRNPCSSSVVADNAISARNG